MEGEGAVSVEQAPAGLPVSDASEPSPYEVASRAFEEAATAPDVESAEVDPDEQDLATYPEPVRERFRGFTPEERKALYEHAEANAREGLKAVQERERKVAEAEAARAKASAEAEAARAKASAEAQAEVGRFLGLEAQIRRPQPDGSELVLPGIAEAIRLNQTPGGRQQAWAQYGLDEAQLSSHIMDLQERRTIVDRGVGVFEKAAKVNLDQVIRAEMRKAGLDDHAILDPLTGPEQIIPAVVAHLEAKHKQVVDDYEAQLGARDANAVGLRARVAASGRPLATGGRSAAGSGPVTVERLIEEAGSMEEYARRAANGDYAHVTLRS